MYKRQLWDPATGDQLLQHHYWIPIDVVDTDAPEALQLCYDSVEVPVRHTRQTRAQNAAGAADQGSAGAASLAGSASSASRTQSALKPSSSTQYSVTGAGDDVPPVPPLSGSTSTSIQRDKHHRSVTGGKTADKRQRNITFNDNNDKDWEACSDTPIGQVPDYDLAVYLCKTSTQLRMPKAFWPVDEG